VLQVSYFVRGTQTDEPSIAPFVPVVLDAALSEQPALGWRTIGAVRCVPSTGALPDERIHVAATTVYFADLFESKDSGYNTWADVRQRRAVPYLVLGGPIRPEFIEPVLRRSGADLFFSGSGIASFRSFCEILDDALRNRARVEPSAIARIPGVYQIVEGRFIAPNTTRQNVAAVRKLAFSERNIRPILSDACLTWLPYPMFDTCDHAKCTFCDWDPIGLPLNREQRLGYAKAVLAVARTAGKTVSLAPCGPHFDFGDSGFLDLSRELGGRFSLGCRPDSLLSLGPVGDREPELDRIRAVVDAGCSQIHFGVESLNPGMRSAFRKSHFTNEELFKLVAAIQECGGARSVRCLLLMLPPSFTATTEEYVDERIAIVGAITDMDSGSPLRFAAFGINRSKARTVFPIPGTIEYELIAEFYEAFPAHRRAAGLTVERLTSDGPRVLYKDSLSLDLIPSFAQQLTTATIAAFDGEVGSDGRRAASYPFAMPALDVRGALMASTLLTSGTVPLPRYYLDTLTPLLEPDRWPRVIVNRLEGGEEEWARRLVQLHDEEFERQKSAFLERLAVSPIHDRAAYEFWLGLPERRVQMKQPARPRF